MKSRGVGTLKDIQFFTFSFTFVLIKYSVCLKLRNVKFHWGKVFIVHSNTTHFIHEDKLPQILHHIYVGNLSVHLSYSLVAVRKGFEQKNDEAFVMPHSFCIHASLSPPLTRASLCLCWLICVIKCFFLVSVALKQELHSK